MAHQGHWVIFGGLCPPQIGCGTNPPSLILVFLAYFWGTVSPKKQILAAPTHGQAGSEGRGVLF